MDASYRVEVDGHTDKQTHKQSWTPISCHAEADVTIINMDKNT